MRIVRVLQTKLLRLVTRLVVRVLAAPQVQASIWEIVNRPQQIPRRDAKKRAAGDISVHLYQNASRQTARYVERHMLTVSPYKDRNKLLAAALEKASPDGLYLEFGSGWTGNSTRFIAARIDATLHGFDSFEGLPEAWFGEYEKGSLSTQGELPHFADNVELHKGWFQDTLPEFVAVHPGQIAFMHVDCDLYSSTKTIFEHLRERIGVGTVIQFDEYFNYPGWKYHEYKAFQEFLADKALSYEYLGYDKFGFSVAVVIVDPASKETEAAGQLSKQATATPQQATSATVTD